MAPTGYKGRVVNNLDKIMFFKIFYISFIVTFLLPTYSYSDVYRWTDKKGFTHITNDPSDIPDEYSEQIKTIKVRKSEKTKDEEGDKKENIFSPSIKIFAKETKAKEDTPTKTSDTDMLQPDNPNAIQILGDLKEGFDHAGNHTYKGSAINKSNSDISNIKILFLIKGKFKKELEVISSNIGGRKGSSTLTPGEIGFFYIKTSVDPSLINEYEYQFKWDTSF